MDWERERALEAAAALLDVVYVLRLEPDMAFEYVSPSVVKLVGYTPQDHYANPNLGMEILDPTDMDELLRASRAPLGEDTEFTVRWITRDGRRVWTHHRAVRTRRDDGSVALYGAARDVTVQEQDKQRQAEAEQRYRLLAENSSDFVALSDENAVLQWVSDSVTRALGWRPEQMVGRNARDFLDAADKTGIQRYIERLNSGQPFEVRYQALCADGSHRWISHLATPIFDEAGRIVSRVSGFRDVQAEVEAEQALAESMSAMVIERARLRASMDAMLDPQIVIEAIRDVAGSIVDFRILDANQAAFQHFAHGVHPLIGAALSDIVPGQREAGLFADYVHVVETGEPLIRDAFAYADDLRGGQVRLFDVRGVKVRDGLNLTLRDVTERELAAERIAESQARYRLLVENSSDVVWQVGPDARIAWVSESVTPVLAWKPDELLGRGLDLLHPDDRERASLMRDDVQSGNGYRGEFRVERADGTYRWMAVAVKPVVTDGAVNRVVALRDIEDEVAARASLEHALGHDPLTGLATRRKFVGRLRSLLAAVTTRWVGVLCVRVDSLSDINSALGHAAGDRVLKEVTRRVLAATGDPDVVGRGGGNEFFVMVPGLVSPADAALAAQRIRDRVRAPFLVDGYRVDPTVSVGVTTGSRSAEPEGLLRDAALALSRAKSRGPDSNAFADPALAQEAARRLTVAAGVREGLDHGEFVAWFQPIVVMGDSSVAGYESLVRWIHTDGGLDSPDAFLPVAEANGLICDIDMSVLRQAASALDRLAPGVSIAVNAAAGSLADPRFPDLVLQQLAVLGVDPRRLHMEVTETTLLTVNDNVLRGVGRLADAGVQWYVDDFGTGYSSISHLRDLPISGLKLDRSFTAHVTTDPKTRDLSHALGALAHALGLDTVAEGVETAEQAAILIDQGWIHGQGWLYGRPGHLPTDGRVRAP